MNSIFIFLWYVYFYTFIDLYLVHKADKRYRLVQKGNNQFEIQCYQQVNITSYSGETGKSIWKWTPILNSITIYSEVESVNRDCYKQQCQNLRKEEYLKLKNEYINKIEKHRKSRKSKYPKVIF